MSDGPARRGNRLASRAYQVVVSLYLAGLVVWLVLGVVPSLADVISPLHRGLLSVGDGSGPLALYARRVTGDAMAMGPVVWVASAYLFSLLNLALGVLLMVKRPDDLVPRLLALAFMGTAATFNAPSHDVFHVLGEPPAIKLIHFTFHVVSGSAYLLAVVLFPRGRMPLPWPTNTRLRRLAGVVLTAVVALICWRSSFIAHPPFFVVFFGVLIPVVGIAAQTLQLRTHHDLLSDEQSRLLRIALLPALTVALVWLGGHALSRLGWGGDLGDRVATDVQLVFPAVFAVVPVMLFVAIVRHQLWDIDLVASRALLVATLLTLVTATYVALIAITGFLLRGSGWAVLVPLVVVACVAEPVRERCQAMCNRLVFGQRMSPRDAIRSLVDRFSGVGDVDELTELTRVVVQSTRASSAAIWLTAPSELVLLARDPVDPAATTRIRLPILSSSACTEALRPAESWPVTYEGALLAVISVSTTRGISLTTKESRLLDDLSHHAGLLVRNAQLTVDLERELAVVSSRAAELRRSRQEVVLAQDEQRLRLERDIHDGAQQQLVALLIMLRGLVRRTGPAHPPPTEIAQLRTVLTDTQETLTQLSRGGAPSVLVDSGLAAALVEAGHAVSRVGPTVDVRVTTPALGVETETAVYFCCLEALQNAVKHASARQVRIEVVHENGQVTFSVADDGTGFDETAARAGSGLANLRARLLPLGGRVTLESSPGGGTTVRGELPPAQVPQQRGYHGAGTPW